MLIRNAARRYLPKYLSILKALPVNFSTTGMRLGIFSLSATCRDAFASISLEYLSCTEPLQRGAASFPRTPSSKNQLSVGANYPQFSFGWRSCNRSAQSVPCTYAPTRASWFFMRGHGLSIPILLQYFPNAEVFLISRASIHILKEHQLIRNIRHLRNQLIWRQ